jgi:hypothetical protein
MGYNGKNRPKATRASHPQKKEHRLTTSETEASLQGQHSLINRQLDLNAKVARVSTQETEEVAEDTARLRNELQLLFKDGTRGVPREYKESAHWALACVKVFV